MLRSECIQITRSLLFASKRGRSTLHKPPQGILAFERIDTRKRCFRHHPKKSNFVSHSPATDPRRPHQQQLLPLDSVTADRRRTPRSVRSSSNNNNKRQPRPSPGKHPNESFPQQFSIGVVRIDIDGVDSRQQSRHTMSDDVQIRIITNTHPITPSFGACINSRTTARSERPGVL